MNAIIKKLSWEKIVENYPDTWVALTDCQVEGVTIVAGRIVAVCKTNQERLIEEKRLASEQINFKWRYTIEKDGAFVL